MLTIPVVYFISIFICLSTNLYSKAAHDDADKHLDDENDAK